MSPWIPTMINSGSISIIDTTIFIKINSPTLEIENNILSNPKEYN
uniref:Uncharacterized protein n=1 Tax=Manihot esculenta TaxID=3983 RepID=A0A2C9WN97_MANES